MSQKLTVYVVMTQGDKVATVAGAGRVYVPSWLPWADAGPADGPDRLTRALDAAMALIPGMSTSLALSVYVESGEHPMVIYTATTTAPGSFGWRPISELPALERLIVALAASRTEEGVLNEALVQQEARLETAQRELQEKASAIESAGATIMTLQSSLAKTVRELEHERRPAAGPLPATDVQEGAAVWGMMCALVAHQATKHPQELLDEARELYRVYRSRYGAKEGK